jgi:hypothetical protein
MFAKDANDRNLLIADYSGKKICIYSDSHGVIWSHQAKNPYDVCFRKNGNILYADKDGVSEIVPNLEAGRGGTVLWTYKPGSATNYAGNCEVFSCEVQPNGNVVTTESGSLLLIELSRKGEVVSTTPLKCEETRAHNQVRLARRSVAGNQLVAFLNEGWIKEIDSEGKELRVIDMKQGGPAAHNAYQVLGLPNGNILVSGADLRTVTEFNPGGGIVWQMKPEDVPEMDLGFLTGIERLGNGNTIVCNWAWAKSKWKSFEITPDKKVVWKLDGTHIKAPTMVLVLPDDFPVPSPNPEKKEQRQTR